MKLILFIVLVFIVGIGANFISRTCKCKAVSDTVHFTYHSWEVSSCKFCSCKDAAMVNCETACKSTVENYVNTGCGKLTKGTKVKSSYEASNCGSGHGTHIHTCV